MNTIKVTPRLLHYLGVPRDSRIEENISLLLDEALFLWDPKTWRRCVSVDEFYDLFHPYARQSKSITGLLARSAKVWLMAVTLGPGVECRSKKYLRDNKIFQGYILDRLGSFLVEQEIKKMDQGIAERCKEEGCDTTRRYSPGYGDFSIAAQPVFLGLVKDVMPVLKLSPSYILSPEKTITAIKGVT